MLLKQSFQILAALAITMICLFFQATGQILMTAKHLIAKTDSLAATYASNAKQGFIQTSEIDTNGTASIWNYTYFSFDSSKFSNSRAYNFSGQNNQVTFESWDSLGIGPFIITNRWMDSDSALLIAQRVGGSALRSQFTTGTISALLMQMPAPPFYTVWQISYQFGGSTRSVRINATTGDTVGVWVVTSVNNANNHSLPIQFELHQNFPNPVNPSTIISFSITSRSYVSLKIFDFLGREIATIVSGELEPGNYTRQWNAANMASGVYFYRLQAGTYSETKKLLLLK